MSVILSAECFVPLTLLYTREPKDVGLLKLLLRDECDRGDVELVPDGVV
jgi:hypothetical protein